MTIRQFLVSVGGHEGRKQHREENDALGGHRSTKAGPREGMTEPASNRLTKNQSTTAFPSRKKSATTRRPKPLLPPRSSPTNGWRRTLPQRRLSRTNGWRISPPKPSLTISRRTESETRQPETSNSKDRLPLPLPRRNVRRQPTRWD